MDVTGIKCAIVIADHLSAGLAANAVAVLSVSLGARQPQLVGPDLYDADGHLHHGLISIPIPVLRTDLDRVRTVLRGSVDDPGLLLATFTSMAQSCRTYDEYRDRLSRTATSDLDVVGVALYGPRKRVDRLVGALPLLR